MMATYREMLSDGQIFQVVVDALTSALPLPLVALVFFGSIGGAYYLVQQRVIIPFVMLILIGGVTISRAPPIFAGAILAILVLTLAVTVYGLLQRVSTQ